MKAVNIQIGRSVSDHADDEADGDALYLHIGQPQPAEGDTVETSAADLAAALQAAHA